MHQHPPGYPNVRASQSHVLVQYRLIILQSCPVTSGKSRSHSNIITARNDNEDLILDDGNRSGIDVVLAEVDEEWPDGFGRGVTGLLDALDERSLGVDVDDGDIREFFLRDLSRVSRRHKGAGDQSKFHQKSEKYNAHGSKKRER